MSVLIIHVLVLYHEIQKTNILNKDFVGLKVMLFVLYYLYYILFVIYIILFVLGIRSFKDCCKVQNMIFTHRNVSEIVRRTPSQYYLTTYNMN